jgi:hypothetical protein
MRVLSLRTAAIALVAGLGLGGCAYGPYGGVGVGYGNGYYGNNGYYDPYYGGGYGYSPYGYGAGYGYGDPYYGWSNGFYYPGTGYYVYDQYRRPHRWSDDQRRYWESRRERYNRGDSSVNRIVQNWADFQNGPRSTNTTRQQDVIRQQQGLQERTNTSGTFRDRNVSVQQQINAERARARFDAQQARSEARSSAQAERRASREEVRSERRGLRVRNARGTEND